MFELNLYQKLLLQANFRSANGHAQRYGAAIELFRQTLWMGRISRIKKRFLQRRQWLYDLASIKSSVALRGLYYSGIRSVAIKDIIGTEGRMTDFDIDFHPLGEEARERWVNMALVFLSQIPLPPVELIQIDGAYFVRDGHHRISVARALGQISMDAEVIVWKSFPPYPWKMKARLQPVHLTS